MLGGRIRRFDVLKLSEFGGRSGVHRGLVYLEEFGSITDVGACGGKVEEF